MQTPFCSIALNRVNRTDIYMYMIIPCSTRLPQYSIINHNFKFATLRTSNFIVHTRVVYHIITAYTQHHTYIVTAYTAFDRSIGQTARWDTLKSYTKSISARLGLNDILLDQDQLRLSCPIDQSVSSASTQHHNDTDLRVPSLLSRISRISLGARRAGSSPFNRETSPQS